MEQPIVPRQARRMEISDWRPFVKNTLQAFFSITTPAGMRIHGLTLHQRDRRRWVGMPGKPFTKDDGTTSYTPVIEFVSRDVADKFCEQALQAIDEQILAAAGGNR